MRTVVHLLASTFVGGPERQMLGLAKELSSRVRTVFLAFGERGLGRAFLRQARLEGFEAHSLRADTPWLGVAIREITRHLADFQASVLCCHGYKANLLGRLAARRAGVPVAAISRGWTGESLKVRLYEWLDRYCLQRMDRVVCVSQAQAERVRRAGVREEQVRVIANSIDCDRFRVCEQRYRGILNGYFERQPTRIVGAAGRLSPEKGFDVLVAAAGYVLQRDPGVGFVIFGDGPRRQALEERISAAGLSGQVVLPGLRTDLDQFMPHFDLLALPSYTEGMPNVVLEAFAAGVPVVATAVGGTPEVVISGVNGYLARPGDPHELADRITEALGRGDRLPDMGEQGRQRVREEFSFANQAALYAALLDELCPGTEPTVSSPALQHEAMPTTQESACTL
jgi:glycosyltransferase involved in cell wall biosynthesis